ncbi:hypothetical protein BJX61DRAFT_542574 [Aspergillus egyptiacus]|nr:hypothetical protein BJX61DRAFT_542574 [Aspergillus egyptiacus]
MEKLPKGLVSTSGKVSAQLDGIDTVDVGDIVQLWKGALASNISEALVSSFAAYSTNPSVHAGDTGHRLQNFFWRIWSSKRLSSTMTGSTLARLFLQISEPSSLTRAKESEPPSSSLKVEKQPRHPSSGSTSKSPLPPILKKSNSSSHGETHKTTRLLLTGLGGESVTRKPSNPPTPVPPSRPVLLGEQSSSRQSQKKAIVVPKAKTKSTKRRPVLMRRKSSQQSSVSSTRAHSPQSPPSVSPLNKDQGPELPEYANEANESAIEDPPDEQTPTPTPTPPPDFPKIKIPTTKDSYTQTHNEDTDTDSEHEPPPPLPAFLADIKHILHKPPTPLPPLKPRNPKPLVGFFSSTAVRRWDVRHLYEENYAEEQPSNSTLVSKDFRARFAEQKRLAEEYALQMMSADAIRNNGNGSANANANADQEERVQASETATTTKTMRVGEGEGEDGESGTATTMGTQVTVSPSRFGDSQGAASTVATSVMQSEGWIDDGADAEAEADADASVDVDVDADAEELSLDHAGASGGVPVPAGNNASFLHPPLSLPHGPSQLSLLIEHSRNSFGAWETERSNE